MSQEINDANRGGPVGEAASPGATPAGGRYCPVCTSPVLRRSSPAQPDRRGDLVEFRFCVRCKTLLPVGTDEPTPTDGERTSSGPATSGSAVTRTATNATATTSEPTSELTEHAPPALLASSATALAWQLAEFLPPPGQSGTIVDLGAGRGSLLHALAHLGYDVKGCEPSSFLCQIARATYLLGPDVLANLAPERYVERLGGGEAPSVFVAWHVLSRLRQPVELLRTCLTLAPEARLLAEFPVAREADMGPEHVLYPTPATVLHLTETLPVDLVHLSLTPDHQLRVIWQGRDPEIVDLDRNDDTASAGPSPDLEALESAYRALSPGFAHFVPEPAEVDADAGASAGPSGSA